MRLFVENTLPAIPPALIAKARRLAALHRPRGHALLDAEDVAQEALCGLLDGWRRFDPTQSTAAHFVEYRIRGAIQDAYRRCDALGPYARAQGCCETPEDTHTRLTAHMERETEYRESLEESLEERTIRQQRTAHLRAAIARLPAKIRQVMQGELAGQSAQQIAAALHLSPDRIWQIRRAAVYQLRRILVSGGLTE